MVSASTALALSLAASSEGLDEAGMETISAVVSLSFSFVLMEECLILEIPRFVPLRSSQLLVPYQILSPPECGAEEIGCDPFLAGAPVD